MSYKHIPAMLKEVIAYLNCRPGKIYVDATLGGSGHAGAICDRIAPGGLFIGIDQDIDAINHAKAVLDYDEVQIHLLHGNFSNLVLYLSKLKVEAVDGMLRQTKIQQHTVDRFNF